ncbi:MAG: tetratricopeptide repeat protein [Acidobacteriaceae bacterium]
MALLVCFLSFPIFAAQQRTIPPEQAAIAQVEDALRNNDYARTIQLSRAALRAEPRDYRIWTLQGLAYAGSGQPSLALSAYEHALRLVPDYLPALEGAAQVNYQQGHPAAKPLLEHLLRLQPKDPTTHAMLGTLAYKSGDCKGAILHFSQAQSVVSAQPSALTQYGICLSRLNRTDEAIPILQQADALAPQDNVTHYNLALMLWKKKRYNEAFQALQPSMQSDTKNEDILTLAADIDEARNDTPHAVDMLRRAILDNPRDPRAYLWFATLASNHSSFQVGIDMLNAGLRELPQEAQLRVARGVLYAQLGKFDEATEDFEAASQLDPQLSFAGTAEGITATQKHDLGAGIGKFREEVRKHPDSAFDQYLLAESLEQRGAQIGSPDYAEELYAATRAVQLDPNLTLAGGILANLYLRSGKTALAIGQCEAMLRTDPNNQEALYHLILALRQSNRKDEIPALTKRFVALRSAEKEQQAHTMRYQLADNVARGADQTVHSGNDGHVSP